MNDIEEYDRIRDAYLAAHPAPEPFWFRCPRCKAEPGQACTGRTKPGRTHAPRTDQSIRAFNLRSLDAANHADGAPTDHHIKYMRRVQARRPLSQEN